MDKVVLIVVHCVGMLFNQGNITNKYVMLEDICMCRAGLRAGHDVCKSFQGHQDDLEV